MCLCGQKKIRFENEKYLRAHPELAQVWWRLCKSKRAHMGGCAHTAAAPGLCRLRLPNGAAEAPVRLMSPPISLRQISTVVISEVLQAQPSDPVKFVAGVSDRPFPPNVARMPALCTHRYLSVTCLKELGAQTT